MTNKEKTQQFLKIKKMILEDIDCFSNDFVQLKAMLEDNLNFVNETLEKEIV